jgi:hypothetical protein
MQHEGDDNPYTSRPVRWLLVGFTLMALLTTAVAMRADDCPRNPGLACPAKTIAASLIQYDCEASDASNFDLWQFTGTAGDTITIDMASTAFSPYVILLDPSDVPVAQHETHIVLKLASTGTYTIVANSLNANQAGDYTLSLSCPATATPIRRRAVGR